MTRLHALLDWVDNATVAGIGVAASAVVAGYTDYWFVAGLAGFYRLSRASASGLAPEVLHLWHIAVLLSQFRQRK